MDHHAALNGAKQLAAAFDRLLREARSEDGGVGAGTVR
jgi:hypothetical protein